MQKYKVGLLIGRFQPFHKGHLFLLRKSLPYVEKLIIGVGSVGVKDGDNFLDFGERKKMLEKVIGKEGWEDRVGKIAGLKDFHNDKLWLKHCLEAVGKIDVVVGNNEWTNGIFERAGYPILRLGFYKRYLYEGEKIRKLMKSGKKWEERVPAYLIEHLTKHLTYNM